MFPWHEIQVPPGFEAVVNQRLVPDRTRILVGRYDRVYFVSFAPHFVEVSCEAPCKEGLIHKLSATVKITIGRDGIAAVLRDAGHSTFRKVLQVTAEGLATRQQLPQSIQASIQSYAHDTGFFDLSDLQSVTAAVNNQVSIECNNARLNGEVVSCNVVRCVPEQSFIAQLAAMAGVVDAVEENVRVRKYRDQSLGRIVDYFIDTLRQQELVQAEAEKARAEAELARLETQSDVAKARADLKIRELEEQDRMSARQAELAEEEAKRQEAAHIRNAQIKERSAGLEHAYNMKRAEEKKGLLQKEAALAQARSEEQAALREQRSLEMQLEREHQRELAEIRAHEKGDVVAQLVPLVEKFTQVPAPNYGNARTLIMSSPNGTPEQATAMVTALVAKLIDSLRFEHGVANTKPAS